MIINEAVSSPVLSNVLAAPSRFKIKASAKAFKILSGFYSEPILAIPRELGANAWDSHVKASNTNKMFEVHAPNTLEPWFAIRDYGTGLSADDIDSIYTTYFESTKTGDNDSDGCMGLGSKTPFNYTDNFNVVSWHKGKKHVYNCFIDETGSPNIMHISTQDSNEHSGLEVKFSVKIADINMWHTNIQRAYSVFRYRPVIVGANIQYTEHQYIIRNNHWALRKVDRGYSYGNPCNAYMGNYSYPISADVITRAASNSNLISSAVARRMLDTGAIDLYFDIGELEVAPNKEQLQYDDTNSKTANAILHALRRMFVEMSEYVKKNMEVPVSLWDAMCVYNKYNSHTSEHKVLTNILGDIQVSYNGSSVNSSNDNARRIINNTFKNDDASKNFKTYSVNYTKSAIWKVVSDANTIALSDRKLYVFHTAKNVFNKLKVLDYLNKLDDAIKKNCTVLAIIDNTAGKKVYSTLVNYFGWDKTPYATLIDIDAMPRVVAARKAITTARTDEVHIANISRASKTNRVNVSWSRTAHDFDLNNTYYYFNFHYNTPSIVNNGGEPQDISIHVDELVDILIHNNVNLGTHIYGINVKNKHMLSVGKWINIVDAAKSVVANDIATYEHKLYLNGEMENYQVLQNLHAKLSSHPSIIQNIKNENTRDMLMTFVRTYTNLHKVYNTSPTASFLHFLGVKKKQHAAMPMNLEEFKTVINDKYFNILDAIPAYSNQIATLYNIINFIDEKS
jgi:hypothetical protein